MSGLLSIRPSTTSTKNKKRYKRSLVDDSRFVNCLSQLISVCVVKFISLCSVSLDLWFFFMSFRLFLLCILIFVSHALWLNSNSLQLTNIFFLFWWFPHFSLIISSQIAFSIQNFQLSMPMTYKIIYFPKNCGIFQWPKIYGQQTI